MNRRGFLRRAFGAAVAPWASKLAPLAIAEKAIAVPLPTANLTARYNEQFMAFLYSHLSKIQMTQHLDEAIGDTFRHAMYVPLPADSIEQPVERG